MKTAPLTARQAGLVNCGTCQLSNRMPAAVNCVPVCSRCGSRLHSRKPNSLSRTWALLLTAAILYFPANTLPMMITSSFGSTQTDTILSGVLVFYETGSLGIALIIFTASIFIPIFKLLTLSYLLLCIQCRWVKRPRDKTRIFRLIELIGRWSMIDVFVVTLMIALIKLGAIADLSAGPAALYFAAVVIFTMFASKSFDPRLIWDSLEEKNG